MLWDVTVVFLYSYVSIIDLHIYIYIHFFIIIHFIVLVAYRIYAYKIFAATSVGEGPPAGGSFISREDSELIVYVIIVIAINVYQIRSYCPVMLQME